VSKRLEKVTENSVTENSSVTENFAGKVTENVSVRGSAGRRDASNGDISPEPRLVVDGYSRAGLPDGLF
jgi:hypothetical protein